MEVTVSFKNVNASDKIRERASEQTEKLSKFIKGPVHLHFICSQDKLDNKVELTLSGDGLNLSAHDTAENFFSAIDTCVDKMVTQLKKHKEKVTHRKGSKKAGEAFTANDEE